MNLSIIAAIARNGVIGNKGKLAWSIPEELKHFRATTEGHSVVMGRKTYESIGFLPDRKNYVISTNPDTPNHIGMQAVMQRSENEKMFIIGGAEIYKLFMPYANELILSHLKHDYEGDAYFPEFSRFDWAVAKEVYTPQFLTAYYTRRQNG